MNKLLFYILSGVIGLFLLISCGGKSSSDLNADVARFVTSSDEVVGYGYVNLLAIKGKAQLSQVPTLGEFVNKEMKSIENSLKLTDKIHYAFEGPFNKDGMPKFAYVFMTVEDKDSVSKMFEKMGFFFEKENDLMVSYDMNMAVGFNEHTIVMVSGNFGDNPKGKMIDAFASFEKKKKDEEVTAILAQTTDILLAGNLEALYATSNTSLQNLDIGKQAEIEEMLEDGHFSLMIDFNDGNLTANLDFSRVSDEMKEKSIFKDQSTADVLAHLGPGEPILAIAMALDVENLEDLIEEFSPDSEQSFFHSLGPIGAMFNSLAEDNIANLMNGDIGMMINAAKTKDVMGFASIPNSHVYFGLGKNPKNMKDLVNTYAREEEMVEDLEEGYYKINESMMLMNDEFIVLHSNDSLKTEFEVGPIEKSEGMEEFGETPFSVFIDLKKFSDSEYNPARGKYGMLIEKADYITLNGDNTSLIFKLEMKNKEENILKQLVDAFKDELKNRMGAVEL